MIKNKFLFSLVAVLILFSWIRIAEAGFTATPMEFHLEVAEGEETTQTFYVRNRGDETMALKVYVGDFWIEPDGKEKFLESGEVERTCSKWIEVAPEELEIKPDESQAIRFKMNVPPDKKGTYWAMVFVEQTTKPTLKTAKRGQQQFNILSFQRVGVRIFEEVPGAQKGDGKISEVSVKTNEQSSLKVELRFENEGDVLLKCTGTIDIKDEKGETAASVNLNEFNCYPHSARIASSSIEEKLAPGQYTALAMIDYGTEYLIAGEAVFEVK